MPLLIVQFRKDAVFQADKPVTVWGSTRQYGDWQNEPEKGDCKVSFEFGPESGPATIKKIIAVTPEMAEWKVTLPPTKAGPKPHTLKVHFTIDGEKVHERVITGIVYGDVWCVVAPAVGKKARKKTEWKLPEVKPSGQIVRMIENQSNRDGRPEASRFSMCTSRTPLNRLAARWKDADGLAAAIGNSISAKTGRPIGIIYLQAKKDIPLKNWIAPSFLKDTPTLMPDYKTIGSQYFDNPYYLANVQRYIKEWQAYWGEHIPAMMQTKAVPDGSSWGQLPSPKPDIGDSTATFEYNVYVHCFTPAALSGIVFLTGESMVADDQGANFGPEMTVLANSFKTRFSLWQDDEDIPFFYTVPGKALAPKLTPPKAIKGKNTAVKLDDWLALDAVIKAMTK